MTGLFPTQEIGSLARPHWQLLGQRGEALDDRARKELGDDLARYRFTAADDPRLTGWLDGTGASVPVPTIRDWGALFALRFLETAGLDRVYDGEARRVEMYEHAARQIQGFQFLGHVRSFDSKYYLKAAVTEEVRLERPYDLEEFEFVRQHARAVPKVPITGPYTLADWSYNEYYLGRRPGWKGRSARREAQRDFVLALARQALRPTIQALVARGAKVIQIDEPAAGTHPDQAELVAEGFNAATEGIDAEFSMHICFSDYPALFPALLEAKRCRQWALEFANRDTPSHDGYALLDHLRDLGDTRAIGLGVVDVHRDEVESAELVASRILRAAQKLGDPLRIWVNPDCGLRTRRLEVARAKLERLVEGARRARAELESPRR